eukprot:CAMPEP_0194478596 /NCGR_PEP_ID=MMETSP0253-20130528/1990_1 /TAXON_ID=2966 /ORGANISM="Noctiluca scintillans" /LENGTH=199 /DNA_ID=CAMNT_0039317705 /DNA_START=5 /DNA_END=600 /DNA_ORIENTATION=-
MSLGPSTSSFLASSSGRSSWSFSNFRESIRGIRGGPLRDVTPSIASEGESELDVCFPGLTIRQRGVGALTCLGVGCFLQVLSFGMIASVLTGHVTRFAFFYTVGNLVALAGTGFVVGPARQCKKMWKKRRIFSSAIYISSLVLTVFVVFKGSFHGKTLLVMLLVIVQYLALTWYVLSYIPFAQRAVTVAFSAATRQEGA